MKAGVGDLGKVVVLIVVADIVSNGIQRPIVAIRLLPLHDITPALQQDIPIYIATRAAQPARVTEQCSLRLQHGLALSFHLTRAEASRLLQRACHMQAQEQVLTFRNM